MKNNNTYGGKNEDWYISLELNSYKFAALRCITGNYQQFG